MVVVAFGAFRAAKSADMGFLAWDRSGPRAAGISVGAAGVYQLTPLKQACLRHCRTPLHFVMHRWRRGVAGAFAMGIEHGGWCLGCCAGLMLMLLVVGVTSVTWMAVVAALVFAEKVLPSGGRLSGVIAVILVAFGVWIARSQQRPGAHHAGDGDGVEPARDGGAVAPIPDGNAAGQDEYDRRRPQGGGVTHAQGHISTALRPLRVLTPQAVGGHAGITGLTRTDGLAAMKPRGHLNCRDRTSITTRGVGAPQRPGMVSARPSSGISESTRPGRSSTTLRRHRYRKDRFSEGFTRTSGITGTTST